MAQPRLFALPQASALQTTARVGVEAGMAFGDLDAALTGPRLRIGSGAAWEGPAWTARFEAEDPHAGLHFSAGRGGLGQGYAFRPGAFDVDDLARAGAVAGIASLYRTASDAPWVASAGARGFAVFGASDGECGQAGFDISRRIGEGTRVSAEAGASLSAYREGLNADPLVWAAAKAGIGSGGTGISGTRGTRGTRGLGELRVSLWSALSAGRLLPTGVAARVGVEAAGEGARAVLSFTWADAAYRDPDGDKSPLASMLAASGRISWKGFRISVSVKGTREADTGLPSALSLGNSKIQTPFRVPIRSGDLDIDAWNLGAVIAWRQESVGDVSAVPLAATPGLDLDGLMDADEGGEEAPSPSPLPSPSPSLRFALRFVLENGCAAVADAGLKVSGGYRNRGGSIDRFEASVAWKGFAVEAPLAALMEPELGFGFARGSGSVTDGMSASVRMAPPPSSGSPYALKGKAGATILLPAGLILRLEVSAPTGGWKLSNDSPPRAPDASVSLSRRFG